MEKYCKAGQATDDYSVAHAHCMLDNKGYRHTQSICIILIGTLKKTKIELYNTLASPSLLYGSEN